LTIALQLSAAKHVSYTASAIPDGFRYAQPILQFSVEAARRAEFGDAEEKAALNWRVPLLFFHAVFTTKRRAENVSQIPNNGRPWIALEFKEAEPHGITTVPAKGNGR
jgi:hypothetical protein